MAQNIDYTTRLKELEQNLAGINLREADLLATRRIDPKFNMGELSKIESEKNVLLKERGDILRAAELLEKEKKALERDGAFEKESTKFVNRIGTHKKPFG